VPPKNLRAENPQFSPICGPKIDTLCPAILMRGKSGNLNNRVNLWLRTSIPNMGSSDDIAEIEGPRDVALATNFGTALAANGL